MFKLVHVPWLHHPFCTGRSVLQKARNADVAAAALLIRSRKEGNFPVLLQPTVHTQPKGLPPFGGDSGARVTVNRTQLARDQARLRQSASSSRPTVLLPHLPEHLK